MLNSKFLESNLHDKTFWDDLVTFVQINDEKWFNDLVVPTLSLYHLEYVSIYNLKGNIVRDAFLNNKTTIPLNSNLLKLLNKKKQIKYYTKIKSIVFEVFVATIHPTNDPLKKTNPKGYYLIARKLDQPFLNELGKISNSTLKFSLTNSFPKYGENYIQFPVTLKDYSTKKIGYLLFKRPFYVDYKQINKVLFLIIFVIFINIIFYLFFIKIWIKAPLQLVTNILKNDDKSVLPNLKESPGEFAYIGELIEDTILQKEELEVAKIKAEESDRLKTSFLTNLSHEIRTPMNAIIGFTNMIKNEKLEESEFVNYLNIIESSGNNLISIIDDLIEMSKIDANQIKPNYTTFNLHKILTQLYNSIRVTIPTDKKLQLIYKPDKPIIIVSDEIKLKQIVSNLLTNAIKFTPSGTVEFGYTINSNKSLIFYVKDSGIGIDSENISKIFDRFKRVDNEYGVLVGGLGLGLSICKAYTEMLGGTINASSVINKGSNFIFEIPLKEAEADVNSAPISQDHIESSNISKSITVLVAEDDNINFILMNKLLSLRDINIIRAYNGKEALEIIQNTPNIDLILMDIKMPIMNGFEAYEKIREINKTIPIIAQTAYSANDEITKITKMGFDGYVTKPIDKDKLYANIIGNLKS